MGKDINVFVVDDSAIVRTTIKALLESENDINILGTASDPIIAQEKFKRNGKPDVIILDIEMPRMDGLTFLKKIMAEDPIPVIICSSVAQEGSSNAIEALFLGAVEVIAKPDVGVKGFLEESRAWLIHAIHAAFKTKPVLKSRPILQHNKKTNNTKLDTDVILKLKNKQPKNNTHSIIAIGASTGGVQTLEKILSSIPEKAPPILITQHMPPGFTKSLAYRLDKMSALSIKEAVDGDKLLHGRALIAPGDKHMILKRSGNSYIVEIKDGPRVSRHKPSVDVLFRSCANEAGANAIGFILTGMGDDGAKGLKEMRDCGARTYSQNENSCIVYGMPKIAMEIGASMDALSINQIVDIIKKG
ncbi:chemotaxis response regulator protein-glutamate methylesterase [Sulfurimonas sp.]|uniref:protein-glutamate methylesterase/protein-glutamine glutaminase n=1 Tax=Sulfurimonas sp. TaxID=2022749 RepID=UPI0035676E90